MALRQCEKCDEMVDEAKAFCPGCGHAFVEEEARQASSGFDKAEKTVQLGQTMYNQMLSEMGLNISKKGPEQPETRVEAIAPAAPPPDKRTEVVVPAAAPPAATPPAAAPPAAVIPAAVTPAEPKAVTPPAVKPQAAREQKQAAATPQASVPAGTARKQGAPLWLALLIVFVGSGILLVIALALQFYFLTPPGTRMPFVP